MGEIKDVIYLLSDSDEEQRGSSPPQSSKVVKDSFNDQSSVRDAPEVKEEGSDFCEPEEIDPSTSGWHIRLDIKKEDFEDEKIKKMINWSAIGVFDLTFEDYGSHKIAIITSSGNYDEDHFDFSHLALFNDPKFDLLAEAPSHCLRSNNMAAQIKEDIKAKIELTAYSKVKIEEASRQILSMDFNRIIITVRKKNAANVMQKIQRICETEDLQMSSHDLRLATEIIVTKRRRTKMKMDDPLWAVYLATFKPIIEK
jgi:hypothetical protein